MVVALSLLAVLVGSVLFHLLSPWWASPIASNWQNIDKTILITFWITGVVFIVLSAFLAWCVYRYRHVEGRKAHYEPEATRLEIALAVATTIGVAIMLAPGLVVWNSFIHPPADAATVEIIGQQWQWSYRLPGASGGLGHADTRFVTADNPLGLNPDDPRSKGNIVIPAGDLHLQVNKPVRILMRSIDVIHDFYIPEFRAKMDMMPGAESFFWVTPTRTGTFEILCAAYCGVGHPFMRANVVVESEDDYQKWLQQQTSFAQLEDGAKAARVRAASADK